MASLRGICNLHMQSGTDKIEIRDHCDAQLKFIVNLKHYALCCTQLFKCM